MNLQESTGITLDLSKSNCGIAKWIGGNLAVVDDISFSQHKFLGDVLIAFDDFLWTWVDTGIDWVGYEEVHHHRHATHAEIHYGMVALLAMRCTRLEIPLFGQTSGHIKKVLTGNGRAGKPEMVLAAQRRWPGVGVENHDMADACAVGLAVIAKVQKAESEVEPQLTPF